MIRQTLVLRTSGSGPSAVRAQIGWALQRLPIGNPQAYLSLKGYKEFDAVHLAAATCG